MLLKQNVSGSHESQLLGIKWKSAQGGQGPQKGTQMQGLALRMESRLQELENVVILDLIEAGLHTRTPIQQGRSVEMQAAETTPGQSRAL